MLQNFTATLPVPRRFGMNRRLHLAHSRDGSGGSALDAPDKHPSASSDGNLTPLGPSNADSRDKRTGTGQLQPRSSGVVHGSHTGAVAVGCNGLRLRPTATMNIVSSDPNCRLHL
jgi:hypothetical protein